jgi:hypothetical protein
LLCLALERTKKLSEDARSVLCGCKGALEVGGVLVERALVREGVCERKYHAAEACLAYQVVGCTRPIARSDETQRLEIPIEP